MPISESNKDNEQQDEKKDENSDNLEKYTGEISDEKNTLREDYKNKKNGEEIELIDETDSSSDDFKWDPKDPLAILTDWHWKQFKDSEKDSSKRIRTHRKKKITYYQTNKITNYFPRLDDPRRPDNSTSTSSNYQSPFDVIDLTGDDTEADSTETDTVAVNLAVAETVAVETVAADTVAVDTVAGDTVAADTVAADTVAADTVAADTVAEDIATGDYVASDASYSVEIELLTPINSPDPRHPEPRPSTSNFKH
ncbi:hypothetical protein O0L34_g7631 [Tuta absoluta]|nr:hypothetical protein O0L34_g7631 [Tuta absoluta]